MAWGSRSQDPHLGVQESPPHLKKMACGVQESGPPPGGHGLGGPGVTLTPGGDSLGVRESAPTVPKSVTGQVQRCLGTLQGQHLQFAALYRGHVGTAGRVDCEPPAPTLSHDGRLSPSIRELAPWSWHRPPRERPGHRWGGPVGEMDEDAPHGEKLEPRGEEPVPWGEEPAPERPLTSIRTIPELRAWKTWPD